MGTSRFWYYPNGEGGTLKSVNLQRKVTSRVGPYYTMDQEITQGYGGQVVSTHLYGLQRINLKYVFDVSLTTLTSTLNVVRRELVGLINHLQRGGWVMFAEDYEYAYAAMTTQAPTAGSTILKVGSTNIMPNLLDRSGVFSLAQKEVYVQSDPYSTICEMGYVSTDSHRAGSITLNSAVGFSFVSSTWSMVRERGSYPALRLIPAKRNFEMLRTEQDSSFELELELEEDPTRLSVLAGLGSLPAPTEDAGGIQFPSGGWSPVPDPRDPSQIPLPRP